MLNLAEEIVLLDLDEASGEFKELPPAALGYALAGAVLMDLALHNRIDTDLQNLTVLDPQPIGDPVLDLALQRLGQGGQIRPTRVWLQEIASLGPELKEVVLSGLVARGVLRREERRFLWVFSRHSYPGGDRRERGEIKSRLRELLLGEELPDPRDVVIISLLSACRLYGEIFSEAELLRVHPRILTLARLDLIGQTMTGIIQEIESELSLILRNIG